MMIPDSKLMEILTQLLHRSEKDEVQWQRDRNGPGTCYRVILPNSSLRVAFTSPPSDPDWFLAEIRNREGVLVFDKSVTVDADSESDKEWLQLLRDLYLDAHRSVTGWDKVLAEIESVVADNGVVGVASEEDPS